MKKLVNARIPVLLALSLVAGVAAGYIFVFYSVSLFWLIAVVPAFSAAFVLSAVFAKKPKILILLPALAALIILGGLLCGAKLLNYSSKALNDGEFYSFGATVQEKLENDEGYRIILTNVYADGKKTDGKVVVSVSDGNGDFCDVGYKVYFGGYVKGLDLFPFGKLNGNVHDNLKYSVDLDGGLTASYRFSLFGTIRAAIRNTLYDNCDGDTAAIAYAMLTGNTQGMDESALDSFRYGGVAHIFAVSGLHIGITYGILTFFLKKVRLNKYAAAAICLSAVIFYAGVCGFTLSSVRAVIMCAASCISKLFHGKYDGFNALALAVIVIHLITPTSLFSLGFQLSVCAVGGIFLLSKQIAKPLKKLPRSVSSAAGVSLGAQFGSLPVMLAGLGYLSGAGLILNLIIVPVLSVIFEVLFVSVAVCAALPFAAPYIIPYVALPLQAVVSFLVDAGFEKAIICGFGAGLFALFYFLCLLTVSDKLNVKILTRIIAVACSVCMLCSYTLWRIYAPAHGYKIVASASYACGRVLIKGGGGNVLLHTGILDSPELQKFLSDNYSNGLTAAIILGDEECIYNVEYLNGICDTVYVFEEYFSINSFGKIDVRYETQFTLNGLNFRFEDGYSVMIDCGGVDVAVCAGKVPFESCDLLISSSAAEGCRSACSVNFNGGGSEIDIYRTGDLTFTAKDEKLRLLGIVRK